MSSTRVIRYEASRAVLIHLYPSSGHTEANILSARGSGRGRDVRLIWRGDLDIGLADLHGLSARQCAVLLCDRLRAAVARADRDPAVTPLTDVLRAGHTAKPPEPPDGGYGGEGYTQEPLPGLSADSVSPGSVGPA